MAYTDIIPEKASASKIIQTALIIAKELCDVPGKSYSQPNRWGPNTYDCSSLMFRLWQECWKRTEKLWYITQANGDKKTYLGVMDYANQYAKGSMWTGTQQEVFTKCGFQVLDSDILRSSNPTGLQAGDVLIMASAVDGSFQYTHTAMVYGRDNDGQLWLVEAGGYPTQGPSHEYWVGFSPYWGKYYWEVALRCPLGYEDNFSALKKLQAEWYVDKIYRTLLGREPDSEELKLRSSQLYNPDTEKHPQSIYYVLAEIIASDEYRKIAYTNEQFVTQMFKVILDRKPDIEGFNHWLSYLTADKMDISVGGSSIEISTRSFVLWELCKSGEANPDGTTSGAISRLYGGLVMITSGQITGSTTILKKNMVPINKPASSQVYYKLDNVWKKAKTVYVKQNGQWKTAKQIYAKDPSEKTLEWLGN